MKRFLCALAGCLCLLLPLMAQSNKLIKELESKRGALQKQIAESESLLQTTTKNVGSQLKGLAALTGQIEERKRYILTINSDMDAIDRELVSLERQLNQLQKELKDKKQNMRLRSTTSTATTRFRTSCCSFFRPNPGTDLSTLALRSRVCFLPAHAGRRNPKETETNQRQARRAVRGPQDQGKPPERARERENNARTAGKRTKSLGGQPA